jgi:hypothetical protein
MSNGFPMQPVFIDRFNLPASTVFDFSGFGSVELDFSGISGHTIIVYRDHTDATKAVSGFYNQNLNGPFTNITANGCYLFMGGGNMKWTVTGGTGTPTCIAYASQ